MEVNLKNIKDTIETIKNKIDTDKDGKIEKHEIKNFLVIWGGYFFTSIILLSLYYEEILKTMFETGSIDFAFIWKNIFVAGILGVFAKLKTNFNTKTLECLNCLDEEKAKNKELEAEITKMKHQKELTEERHQNEINMINEQHKLDLMEQKISAVSKSEIAKVEIAKNN